MKRTLIAAYLALLITLVPAFCLVWSKAPEPEEALSSPSPSPAPTVLRTEHTSTGSAAEAAGIREGDTVVAVNGRYGVSPQELLEVIRRNATQSLQLVLEDKDGGYRTVAVTPRMGEAKASDGSIERRPLLGVYVGIKPDIVWIKKGPIEALGAGISRIGSISKTTYNAVRDMPVKVRNLAGGRIYRF